MRHARSIGSLVVTSAMLCGSLVVAGRVSAATTWTPRLLFAGHAFGTSVQTPVGVSSGKSANLVASCSSKEHHRRNAVASVDAAPVLAAGTVTSRIDQTRLSGGARRSVTTSHVSNLALLGGLIQADELKAVSTTIHRASGYQTSDAGGVWVHLNVLGQPMPPPSPNTVVDLPGIGTATLNEQIKRVQSNAVRFTINLIHIVTTIDSPLTPKGTQIIVGHAASGVAKVGGPMGGTAYTSQLDAAGALSSGPSGVVYLPCAGTDGKVLRNSVAQLNLPDVLGLGTGDNQVTGRARPNSDVATAKAVAQGVNLLKGVISADSITARVHGSGRPGHKAFTDTGSGFENLVVQGQAQSADVPRNTQITIPGVGTLWLHRVIRTRRSMEVRMVELEVTDASSSLPVGADIRLGVARLVIFG